jgi:hypothetical protein
MPNVISSAGDCFASIAKSEGFFNYRSIYDHDDNAAKFPNPNQIEEGSTVKVPDKKMKAFDLILDGEKKFKIDRKKVKLHVRICKADTAQAPEIAKATLALGGKKAAGKDNLEIDEIDSAATAATLTVVLSKPRAYAAAPATEKGVADQYPPPIVADDFDDPKTVWPKTGETFSWQLQVGHLEPQAVTRGVLQRLQNLGYTCPVSKAEDDATKRAVKCYRRFVEAKDPPADTDAAADIADHIKTRHDD